MPTTKQWVVEVDIDEFRDERCTHAVARLRDGVVSVQGAGSAYRHPRDAHLPEVGDELAAARALTELARRLRSEAEQRVEQVTSRPWPPESL